MKGRKMSDLPTILFTCEACGIQGRVPEAFRGKTARCPSCKHVQVIPLDAPSPPVSGGTQRIAQPTITRSFANPSSGKVSDTTQGQALLGITNRLEKLETLQEQLQTSLEQSRSHGDGDLQERVLQLQGSLAQTEHAVASLRHVETRVEALAKKVEVVQRSLNRQEHDRQTEEIFAQLKRLERQLEHGTASPQTRPMEQAASSEDLRQHLDLLAERLAQLEAQLEAGAPAASTSEHHTSDQDLRADLELLSNTVSQMRQQQEEDLEELRQSILQEQAGEKAHQEDPIEPEIITAIQQEVADLRDDLQHLSRADAKEPAAGGGSPLLAILALLIAILAGAAAGFLFVERGQQQSHAEELQAALDDQTDRIQELRASMQEQQQGISDVATAQQGLRDELATAGSALRASEERLVGLVDDVDNLRMQGALVNQRLDGSEAALEDLRAQTTALSSSFEGLRQRVENLPISPTVDEAGIRSSIESLSSQLSGLRERLQVIANQVETLSTEQEVPAE